MGLSWVRRRAHDLRWRDQSHAGRHAVTWHACTRRSDWGPHGPLWSFAHCWSTITMIPPVRQEILRVLADLSACCPDVRFGQLLANLSYWAKGPTNEAIWEKGCASATTSKARTSSLKTVMRRGAQNVSATSSPSWSSARWTSSWQRMRQQPKWLSKRPGRFLGRRSAQPG